jgi:hypothetical protein
MSEVAQEQIGIGKTEFPRQDSRGNRRRRTARSFGPGHQDQNHYKSSGQTAVTGDNISMRQITEVFSISTATHRMAGKAKGLLVSSLMGMAFCAGAQESFQIQGYLTGFSVNNATDYGISSGSQFTGVMTYSPSGPGVFIQGSGGPARDSLGLSGQPFLTLDVNGRELDMFAKYLYAYNGGSDQLSTSWPGHEQGMQVNSPWGNFNSQSPMGLNTASFMLQDSTGTALSSAGLPGSLDVNDWDSHYVDLGYVWTTSDGPDSTSVTHSFYLSADITSIAPMDLIMVVPEPSVISLLALTAGGMAAWRFRRSRLGR